MKSKRKLPIALLCKQVEDLYKKELEKAMTANAANELLKEINKNNLERTNPTN